MANLKEQKGTVEEALSQKEAVFMKHKKAISAAIVVVILIVAGVLSYETYISGPREQEASTALAKGQDYFANQQYEIALKGDSTGFRGLLNIASDYSSTDAGNLANLYAGLCYAQLGKYEDAVKYLDKFSGKDALVAPAVLGTLGNCYAQLGQLDKAASTLQNAAEKANSMTLSPIYLIQAGQILEKQGKNEDAVKVYKEVKTKYANSYQAMDIDKYIERASLK